MAPDYVLHRSYLENNRSVTINSPQTPCQIIFNCLLTEYCSLNLQHYLWVQLFGYHIHPKILTGTGDADLRIADIGTGTG